MADSRLIGVALLVAVGVSGCGGSGDQRPLPTITILNPTTAPTYMTTSSAVRVGGLIMHAGFVHLRNERTNVTVEAFVNYFQGQGSWFGDMPLELGDNQLVAIADDDGLGTRTATASLLVTRQP